MRRLIIFVALFVAVPSFAATFNQCNPPQSSGSTGVSNLNCTLNAQVGANHIILAAVQTFGTGITPTISDTLNLTWNTWKTDSWDTTVVNTIYCAYTGSSTGTENVRVSFSSNATFSSIIPLEETDVTFFSCAQALDATATTASGTASGTLTSNSATSTVGSDTILIAGTCNAAGGTLTAGSGFTGTTGNPFSGSGPCPIVEYKTAGAAGSYNGTVVAGSSTTYLIQLVLIKPGNASSGAQHFFPQMR